MPQSLPLSAAGSRRRWSSRYLVGVQRRAVALVAAPPPPSPSPLAARCVSLVCQKQQEESCPSSQLQLQQLQPQPQPRLPAPAPAPAAIDDDDDPVLVGGTHSTYFFLFLLADRFLRAARSHWVPLKHILLSATAAQIVVHFRSQLIMRRWKWKCARELLCDEKFPKK